MERKNIDLAKLKMAEDAVARMAEQDTELGIRFLRERGVLNSQPLCASIFFELCACLLLRSWVRAGLLKCIIGHDQLEEKTLDELIEECASAVHGPAPAGWNPSGPVTQSVIGLRLVHSSSWLIPQAVGEEWLETVFTELNLDDDAIERLAEFLWANRGLSVPSGKGNTNG